MDFLPFHIVKKDQIKVCVCIYTYIYTHNISIYIHNISRLYIVTLIIYLYADYIMKNARLDEAKARIKIAGRNINNLRYSDNTTRIAESKEDLVSR